LAKIKTKNGNINYAHDKIFSLLPFHKLVQVFDATDNKLAA
jgi:hypothetical protein